MLPTGKDWVNLQYHFIMRGDNTESTDFRKPIKPKTPKAKSKVMKRPTTRYDSSYTASSESGVDDPETGGDSAVTAACPCACIADGLDPSFLGDMEFTDGDVLKAPIGGGEDASGTRQTGKLSALSETTAQARENVSPGTNEDVAKAALSEPQWTVILLCTEPNSLMATGNPFPRSCQVIEITKDDDFTSEAGAQKVKLALRCPNVVVFAFLPCTGGSPWQTVNRRHPACRRLLRKHRLLFDRLFGRLVEIADDTVVNGGLPIIFEWPRHCTYWKLPEVERFCAENGLQKAHFDGCRFGLRSCIAGSESKYLMKPWTFATNLPEVFEVFNGMFCPGVSSEHVHDSTCGRNAKHSQGYT